MKFNSLFCRLTRCVLLSTVITLTAGISLTAQANEPVKIGLVAALCGQSAKSGQAITRGLTIAIEEINAKGGVLGRPLEMISRDDESNPELTVLENIELGAYRRMDEYTRREIATQLNRFPRLKERLNGRAGLLSGGEQQMLAIARGLIAKPDILLLDEPSLGLAPAMVDELYAILSKLRDEGITILLVDQMATLALSIADRAYMLEQGRIVVEGKAEQLASDSRLTAAYLGQGRKASQANKTLA
jgi:ABC-type branched-subunit amino acid transport system ATPase component